MKKYLCLLVLVLGMFSHSYAALDPITAILDSINNGAKAAEDKAFHEWQKLEMVQQTKILYDNYQSGKKYYDEMKAVTEQRRGIGEYASDEMKTRYMNLKDDSYFDAVEWLNTPSSTDTTKVDKFISQVDRQITDDIGYYDEIREWEAGRNKKVAEIAESAKDNITPGQLDTVMLKIAVLQLEYLAAMDRNQNRIYGDNVREQITNWSQDKAELEEFARFQAEMKKKKVEKAKKDVYEVLR